MEKVLTLEHVSWNVSDLERSKHFFQDLLGLEVLDYLEGGGAWVDQMVNVKDTFHQQYRMYAPFGPGLTDRGPTFTIDTLFWKSPGASVRRPSVSDFPQVHVALGVKDLDASYERLEAAGAEFLSPPTHWPEEEGGWAVQFMFDPDGFFVELIQIESNEEAPGEVLTCEHVATTVGDLDRSRHFYIDLLGLEEVSYVEHHGGQVEVMCQTPGMIIREYRTRPRGGPGPAGKEHGFTLDLIEWVTPRGKHLPPPMNQIPVGHFCFGVEDIYASYEQMKEAGVEFISPPVTWPKDEGGWTAVSFHDPDGLLLELVQLED
jgi:catechol 2,3-dioxygenase-like lactoylglutathione lyase family enzyme